MEWVGAKGSVDGMYANFAGRDASRGMAKQSFDTGMLGASISAPSTHCLVCTEMLTPIDQPLDRLEDLTAEETYALPLLIPYPTDASCLSSSENMKGELGIISLITQADSTIIQVGWSISLTSISYAASLSRTTPTRLLTVVVCNVMYYHTRIPVAISSS